MIRLENVVPAELHDRSESAKVLAVEAHDCSESNHLVTSGPDAWLWSRHMSHPHFKSRWYQNHPCSPDLMCNVGTNWPIGASRNHQHREGDNIHRAVQGRDGGLELERMANFALLLCSPRALLLAFHSTVCTFEIGICNC